MTGRLRYVLAAAFVALFVLFPPANHERVAFLEAKAWLAADDDGILTRLAQSRGDRLPSIEIDYASTRSALETWPDRAAEFDRAIREWARGKKIERNEASTPVVLQVRVGTNGFRCAIPIGDGTATVVEILERLHTDVHDGASEVTSAGYYPDRLSLAPAFLAILIAVLTGKVIPALLFGCFAGAWLYLGNPFAATSHLVVDTLGTKVLGDQFHLEILGFVLFLFMSIGVMTRSGGVQGMVNIVSRFARGPVSAQLASWIIGILIFFDDYSNCIITGSTMRPLTDKVGVAREKLAYIVDATAAPIAGISIFSTWVAYEVSTFAPQLPEVTDPTGTPYQQSDGFAIFVQTLPLRFYCVFTLAMVLMTILTRREWGPMLTASRRASLEGKPLADDAKPLIAESLAKTEPPADTPLRARNAVLPVLVLVLGTISLIIAFGVGQLRPGDVDNLPWYELATRILGEGQSQRALCISAAGAFVLSLALAVGQRILSFGDAMLSAIRSARSLVFAMVILVLAWAIGEICGDVGTAVYLTSAFHGAFEPWLLPAMMFALASLIAFSTGTSYGTMAILLPNVVVLAHSMGEDDPNLGGVALMLLTIGAVLEGSIFGDHCSPISDTTVLSSVATGSDHMHHVRTQAPYAVIVMLVAMVFGYLPTAWLGPSYWPVSWLTGGLAMLVFLLLVGRRFDQPAGVTAVDQPSA